MPTDHNFGYYTTHDFRNNNDIAECASNSKGFSTLHFNIRSLSANYDCFYHMLSELNLSFSIIGISETKIIKDREALSNVNIIGYDLVSEPTLSNAGGVAFYIKNNYNYTIRSELTIATLDFEALWIEILANGQPNLVCGVIYRHPHSNLQNFMNYINSTLDKIQQEKKLCLFMGDFNIDLLKIDSHSDSEIFLNDLASSFFQPHILQPTRITDHSATLIDNIFFNSIEHFTISGNVVYKLTDHLANFMIFNNFSALSPNIEVYKRDYSKFNETKFLDEVKSVDWQIVLENTIDPTQLFDSFYAKISEIIDRYVPIKRFSRRE